MMQSIREKVQKRKETIEKWLNSEITSEKFVLLMCADVYEN